jgi:hypothetical protein
MIDPKTQRAPQPMNVVNPTSSSVPRSTTTILAPSPDMIRERAYQLYESRGSEPGHADQDWFRAERELANQPR